MRSDYRKQLTFLPIYDLPSLIAAGRRVDANNFSLYNKLFGTEKTNTVAAFQERKTEVKKPPPRSDNRQPSGSRSMAQSPRPSISHSSVSQSSVQNRNLPKNAQTQPPNTANAHNPGSSGVNSARRSSSMLSALEKLVDSHRPPGMSSCYNCRKPDHQYEECPEPKRVFCLICGFRGFETVNCPYCRKNGIQADQSRGSSHTSPRA